ncbi:hypothetical protein SeLEV6574_g03734 [Synchytrium endobioticum]|uniref:Uncharacterized protein n=1 Tax=Synchytrium endobioticum TaxID=286115 RepID=A0A507D2W6_9FUNG|nr:hypothetical protein SeLEV6574_g03734 [Synchytrium endobioticum]
MKCPVPLVLKVSPKVAEYDDDKYQEPKKTPEVTAVKPSSKAKAKRAPFGRNSRTKTVVKDDSDEESWNKTSPMRPEPLRLSPRGAVDIGPSTLAISEVIYASIRERQLPDASMMLSVTNVTVVLPYFCNTSLSSWQAAALPPSIQSRRDDRR